MHRGCFLQTGTGKRVVWNALWLAALAIGAACGDDPLSSRRGTVLVSLVTEGGDTDDDGYFVSLDGLAPRRVGANSVLTIPRVPVGVHRLSIIEVAPHCSVQGGDRQEFTVRGDTVEVAFHIDCPLVGVQVETQLTGGDLDLDGFTLYVDNQPLRFLAGNDVATVARLSAGTHQLTLSGIAANCTAGTGNTQTVTLPARGLVTIRFQIACVAFSGTVNVSITTSGQDVDRDGYSLWVGQAGPYPVVLGSTLSFPRLAAGVHNVRLDNVASNCVAPGNPRTVTITIGDTAQVAFDVVCGRAERIVYSTTNGSVSSLVVAFDDGSNTTSVGNGLNPGWSPDGSRLVFTRLVCDYWYYYYYYGDCHPDGLATMPANGGPVQILTSSQPDEHPAWSPDGTSIAFSRLLSGRSSLYVTTPLGETITRINVPATVQDASDPSWSPDGTRLAFACTTDGDTEVCVIQRDGSGFARLTNTATFARSPAWSPDGARIAFVSQLPTEQLPRIATMDPAGNGVEFLLEGVEPAWSRDGTKIVFVGNRTPGLHLMNRDGSGLRRITTTGSDHGPAWKP